MSLLEKLNQKKQVKVQAEKETAEEKKMRVLDEISAKIGERKAKKDRLLLLIKDLGYGWQTGNEVLADFKSKKAVLSQAYEENKEILEEDGVKDFSGMLETNATEPEVRAYRRRGGRDLNKEDGAPGETGDLYKSVASIKDLKNKLQDEIKEDHPDWKLNFSARSKAKGTANQRQESLLKIRNYVEELEKELSVLEKQKEEAYLKTDKGARQEIAKNINTNNYRDLSYDKMLEGNFYFQDPDMRLTERFDPEIIKEMYAEKITEKLTKQAWNNNKETGDIENYESLQQIADWKIDRPLLEDMKKQRQAALEHLAKIFQEKMPGQDGVIGDKVKEAGFYYKPGSYARDNTYKDWPEEQMMADVYLSHLEKHSRLMPGMKNEYETCKEQLNCIDEQIESISGNKFKTRTLYRHEFLNEGLRNYSSFFKYIQENTDAETLFVGDDQKDNEALDQRLRDQNFQKEIGLKPLSDPVWSSQKNTIPGNFNHVSNYKWREDLDKARQAKERWEKEKELITEFVKELVDLRFSSQYDSYLRGENRKLFEEREHYEILAKQIKFYLNGPAAARFSNPEFANDKMKLSAPNYHNQYTIFTDVTNEDVYKKYREDYDINKEEIKNFVEEKKRDLQTKMGKINRGLFVFGKQEKLNKIDNAIEQLKMLDSDKPIKESELTEHFTVEEITTMKVLRNRRKEINDSYKAYDAKRIAFRQLFNEKNFQINFKDKDPLNGQEMLLSEVPTHLQLRVEELESLLNNPTPGNEVIIKAQAAAIKEMDVARERLKKVTEKVIQYRKAQANK